MQLDTQTVQSLLDDLAVQIEEYFGQQQTGYGEEMILKLENLRKLLETATPDLIGAYYGYLAIKQEFLQTQRRIAWLQSRFWLWFGWQSFVLILLLGVAIIFHVDAVAWRWIAFNNAFALYLESAWWGAIGATLAALHTMYYGRLHGSLAQNTDAWLIIKPLTGAVLGMLSGFVLQIMAYGTTGDLYAKGAIPLLFAFFAGFSERRFLTYLQNRLGQFLQNQSTINVEAKKKSIG
ncbi:hypothetical protein [Sulfoacidibacillus thermotolerans]|uniref:Uncharacterized protein n=1 Tax=Sulfoacidibacillus thermotolerans TaxID=1765684 RepID=A0A2U3D917_SULT2|nr:hypothetical protein [Sulfoacidibacillus thermotolerans]PWI57767.1 hypothetical protein BM613_07240 [Sulfoacidibacillus thermotolerans]